MTAALKYVMWIENLKIINTLKVSIRRLFYCIAVSHGLLRKAVLTVDCLHQICQ